MSKFGFPWLLHFILPPKSPKWGTFFFFAPPHLGMPRVARTTFMDIGRNNEGMFFFIEIVKIPQRSI